MTSITRTSPLELGEVKKTQRRVAALLNGPDQSTFYIGKNRRRRIPAGFCYLCSRLDPWGGRGGRGRYPSNPHRHLFSKTCPHITPSGPHPTFVGSDVDDYDNNNEDDGFDEGSWDGSEEGRLFDTGILRDDSESDPRLFSLPPVFGKPGGVGDGPVRHKRGSKNGRLVPVVSEKTFVSTNKRADGDHDSDIRLPRLAAAANQRSSLVGGVEGHGQGQGQADRKRKKNDPRRLHSERIDRREGAANGTRVMRSDSALGLDQSHTDLSREKTDPPPQPITVSIKNQDGEVVHRTQLKNIAPGKIPSEAFADQPVGEGREEARARRKREKKKKRRPLSGGGSASPTFSGSMSISRETTLSGWDSPDLFMSRLRSASWCECPEQASGEGRCLECRKVRDHEKWCVSRNLMCMNCGKAFRRKYSQLERKSSFSTIPAQGFGSGSGSGGMMTITNNIPSSSGSPTKNRHHQNCSPTKTSAELRRTSHAAEKNGSAASGDKRSSNRVRFSGENNDAGFPDSETGEERGRREGDNASSSTDKQKADSQRPPKSYLPSIDPLIHQKAYNMALREARFRAMNQQNRKTKKKKNSESLQHQSGLCFSYFPLLKTRRSLPRPQEQEEGGGGGEDASAPEPFSPPPAAIGLRADPREGKPFKYKKGLKHILGDVKLDDFYPGGKGYPKTSTATTNTTSTTTTTTTTTTAKNNV